MISHLDLAGGTCRPSRSGTQSFGLISAARSAPVAPPHRVGGRCYRRLHYREGFTRAAAFALAGAVLTFFGFMHGEAVGIGSGLGVTPSITLGYLMVAGVLIASDRMVRSREPGSGLAAASPIAAE